MNGTFYAVTCPTCHGRMFLDGRLCGQCDGDGRVLIREQAHMSKSGLRTAVFAAITIVILVMLLAFIA